MERVMGIGGVFFKVANKAALSAWYRDNLGLPVDEAWGGAVFPWREYDPQGVAHTVWSPFADDTDYFAPSTKDFMINFRVRDLSAMLDQLRANGCEVDDRTEESEFGKFGWVMDPEGNRIELWEPPAPEAAEDGAT
jgi:catechol 2,3-dioxygenase-like lactoylglutathione lyase family enzyme